MKDIVIIKNSNTLLNNDVYFPDINEIENGELVLNDEPLTFEYEDRQSTVEQLQSR